MQSLYPTAPSELSDDDLVALYAYPHERRHVRANFVTSLDGAAQGADEKSGSLSSKPDKRIFGLLRSLCDVIVVGAGTARSEGYQPVQSSEARAALRRHLGLAPLPALAVVSRSLNLDPTLVHGGVAPTIVITTASAPNDARRKIAAVAPVIVAGELDVDFAQAFDDLTGRGYPRVLCEGGPQVLRDIVAAERLDELCLTISPVLVGGRHLRLLEGGGIEPPPRMQLRHLLESDGELFARYTRG